MATVLMREKGKDTEKRGWPREDAGGPGRGGRGGGTLGGAPNSVPPSSPLIPHGPGVPPKTGARDLRFGVARARL